MKNGSRKKWLQQNLENCRCVSYWQCTPPLTAHQNNALNVLPTAKNSRTVSFLRLIHSIVALFWCVIKGKARSGASGGCFSLPARNLRTVSGFAVLLFQDCLLTEIDEKLPLARHIFSAFQQFHFIQRLFAARYFMRTQEVIVGHPERDAVYSAVFRAITTGNAVRFFESTVQTLNELFKRTEFFRNLIIIGKTDDLGNEYLPVFFNLELLSSKRISAVAIRNESQCFAREFLKWYGIKKVDNLFSRIS